MNRRTFIMAWVAFLLSTHLRAGEKETSRMRLTGTRLGLQPKPIGLCRYFFHPLDGCWWLVVVDRPLRSPA